MASRPPKPPEYDPDFNPYAAPKVESNRVGLGSDEGLYQAYDQLIVRKGVEFPDRCVKCNRPAEGYRLRRNLSWHNPLLYLVILAGLLIYVIVALIVRKTARLYLPLCPEHRARRARTIWAAWLVVLGSIGLMVMGGVLADSNAQEAVGGFMLLGGLLGFLGGLIYAAVATPVVKATKIDDYYVWLQGVAPEFLRELEAVPVYDRPYVADPREPIRFGS